MKLSETLRNRANFIIRRAWVAMGIPFDLTMVNEKKEGIIDIEALLMLTLLLMENGRMVTDLPAWVNRFRGVVNHQKLKTLFKASPEKYRIIVEENIKQAHFLDALPNAFKKIFDIQRPPAKGVIETIETRASKLNSLEHVAQSSIMLKNRLLYGTGFRADVITLAHIKNLKINGNQLARLLCTADSTVSRILSDLRACQFLDSDNERVKLSNSYPAMFLSTQTVWNLHELLYAADFRSEELRKATYENLNFKNDRFCMQLVRKGTAP